MKSLNRVKPMAEISRPKDVPRISRQRIYRDRSEWRKSAIPTAEASQQLIDDQLENARNVPSLESQNYLDLADLMDRAGRIGIDRT
jgi:hypothetical protein